MEGNDQLFKGNDGSVIRFYTEPAKNNFLSEKSGRPVFDNVLYCEVITPGSSSSTPVFELERTVAMGGADAKGERPVVRSHKYDEFKSQIDAYRAQSGEMLVDGTPLTQWPQIDAGTAATLRGIGVMTVEQLAEVSDGNLGNIGHGARILREQARQYLTSRQFGVVSARTAAELENLRSRVAQLEAENAALKAATPTVEAPPPPPVLPAAPPPPPVLPAAPPPPPVIEAGEPTPSALDPFAALGTPQAAPTPAVAPGGVV